MKVYGPLPVGLCRDRSCLGVAEYRLEPEETTAASCCFCGSTTRPFMQVDGPIHGRHVRCLPGHPRPRGQLYLTLTRAGLRGLNLLPTWTLEQKVPTGMRSAHSSGLASQVIAVCPLSSPSGHRRWTVGGALADFHATAEGQRGQIADADPSLVGARSSQVEPLGQCSGAAATHSSATSWPSNRSIVSPWVHSIAFDSPRFQNSANTSSGSASTRAPRPFRSTTSDPRASGWTAWWHRTVGLHKIRSTG